MTEDLVIIDRATAVYTGLEFQIIGEQGTCGDVIDEGVRAINEKVLGNEENYIKDAPYLAITMPCGAEFVCHTEQDVRNLEYGIDIPCTCGNPQHYFVRWIRG